MSSKQPLVSVVVLAYNQENFVGEAIQSALAQTYQPLEILLTDDCSRDGTFAVMEKAAAAYRGPHTVVLNRNATNLGLARHLNRMWEMTHGEFLVIQAGDDLSNPDRTEKLVRRWLDPNDPVDLVCSYCERIDVAGQSTGIIKKDVVFVPDRTRPVSEWRCGATGACASYSRKLYEKYGPLDPNVVAEDWVFSFRAWVEGGIGLIEEPLLRTRIHENSISFLHRNVRKVPERAVRRACMRQNQAGAVAIAEAWLWAWQLGKWREDTRTAEELKRWIGMQRTVLEAFDSSPLRSVPLAARLLRQGGSAAQTAKLLVRHGLRYY